MRINLIFFLFSAALVFFNTGCKKKKPGCIDSEAANYDVFANVDNGTCIYKSPISDPSFENPFSSVWLTYTAAGPYSSQIILSNDSDGFMPTDGNYYYKLIPQNGASGITWLSTYCGSTKHYKGFYFDYSCKGIANSSGFLTTTINIGLQYDGSPHTHWSKRIYEDPFTFGGFPNISIQKKQEYCELPYLTGQNYRFFIETVNSTGTFTFNIDNIRVVQR